MPFHNFHQIFNGDWITSVCAYSSDRKRSTRTSFTRTRTKNILVFVTMRMQLWGLNKQTTARLVCWWMAPRKRQRSMATGRSPSHMDHQWCQSNGDIHFPELSRLSAISKIAEKRDVTSPATQTFSLCRHSAYIHSTSRKNYTIKRIVPQRFFCSESV